MTNASSIDAQPEKPTTGFAVTSLVLGCCSVFFFWLFAVVPILAIIFGGLAIDRARDNKQKAPGMAVAGLVLGVVFLGIYVLILIAGALL